MDDTTTRTGPHVSCSPGWEIVRVFLTLVSLFHDDGRRATTMAVHVPRALPYREGAHRPRLTRLCPIKPVRSASASHRH